jgi:hypothetical protein
LQQPTPFDWLGRAILALALAAGLAPGNALQRGPLTGPAAPVPPTFFGMHMHEAATTTPWPAVPFAAWRLWDAGVSWAELEPQRGQWRWDKLDCYLAMAEEHHVELLLTLGLTPTWASARPQEKSAYWPGNSAPPRDLADWRHYVTEVARRYQGRIAAYEIWNEPDLKQTWTGSVQQMVDLAREASQAIHEIDPAAQVVSPSAAGVDVNWLAEFLARGGNQYVDVIGYHFYVTPKPPEAMLELIRQVKQVMAEHGVAAKPLWNTETGWSRPKPFPSDDLAVAYVARSYILSWAAGVERFYWYAWDNHRWVSLEMTQPDSRELRPAARAYAQLQRWLLGTVMQACDERSGIWVCALHREEQPQWIVWTERGKRAFAVPGNWNATSVRSLLAADRRIENGHLEIDAAPVLLVSQ